MSQTAIATHVLEDMLSSATGNGRLTTTDLSRFLGRRRVQCRTDNPQFSLSLSQKFIGSTKCVSHLLPSSSVVPDY